MISRLVYSTCRSFLLSQSVKQSFPLLLYSRRNYGRCFSTVSFKLSDIGEGIAEVELLKWHKKEEDSIEEMENVCTVQSDKAAVEITSRYTGKVKKLYHKVGDMIKIGSILMDIDIEGNHAEDVIYERIPVNDEEQNNFVLTAVEVIKDSTKIKSTLASPACRRLAKELSVDLANVKGSGKNGIITKEDIEKYAQSKNGKIGVEYPSRGTDSPLTDYVDVPIKGYSRAMVKMMTESLKVPHLNIGEEYDVTNLIRVRNILKPIVEIKHGLKFTFTSLIIKATSLGLKDFPILNSKIDSSGIKYRLYRSHNISVAIDTPNGLVVPNIKNVQLLSITDIQKELLRLQNLASSNMLHQNDLSGGTIAISNVGVIAGTYIKPILFDGQALIIGIGRIRKSLSFDVNKSVYESYTLNCSFSADHRHCDGAVVAKFAARMKSYLENPEIMLLEMN